MHPGTPRQPEERYDTPPKNNFARPHATVHAAGVAVPVKCTYAESIKTGCRSRDTNTKTSRERRHGTIAGEHGAMQTPKRRKRRRRRRRRTTSSSSRTWVQLVSSPPVSSAIFASLSTHSVVFGTGISVAGWHRARSQPTVLSVRDAGTTCQTEQRHRTRCELCVAMRSEHNSRIFPFSVIGDL